MSLPDLSLYGVMGLGSTFSDTKSFIYVIHLYESMSKIVETVWHKEEGGLQMVDMTSQNTVFS